MGFRMQKLCLLRAALQSASFIPVVLKGKQHIFTLHVCMSNLRQHTAGFICLSTSLPESSVSRSWRNGATSMDAINLENSWECSTARLQCAFDTNSLGIMSLTLVVVDVRVCNPFPFLISLCSDSLQGDVSNLTIKRTQFMASAVA